MERLASWVKTKLVYFCMRTHFLFQSQGQPLSRHCPQLFPSLEGKVCSVLNLQVWEVRTILPLPVFLCPLAEVKLLHLCLLIVLQRHAELQGCFKSSPCWLLATHFMAGTTTWEPCHSVTGVKIHSHASIETSHVSFFCEACGAVVCTNPVAHMKTATLSQVSFQW